LKSFTLSLIFVFSLSCFAYTNKIALKAGLSAGYGVLNNRASTSQGFPTLGVASYFGKKWERWEIGFTSQANAGLWKDQSFYANGSILTGRGHFRSLSFGPHVRMYVDYWEKKQWKCYFGLSPLFSIRTFKFSNTQKVGGSYTEGHKLTFESFGPMLSIGWEEQLTTTQRPSFLELNYRYLESQTRTEVGGTTTKVESIIQEQDDGGTSEHTLVITWGMLIF
jgi:hypothetical protein